MAIYVNGHKVAGRGTSATALFVNITGTSTLSADRTNAEIYSAYQAGRPVYAVRGGVIYSPFSITQTQAQFSYVSSATTMNIYVETSGGSQTVSAINSTLSAGSIGFDDTLTQLGASNVQDAIYNLMVAMGLIY